MKYKYFYNLQLQNEKKEWKCLQTQNQNIYKRQKFISNYKTQWIYDCIFVYVYAEQTHNRLIPSSLVFKIPLTSFSFSPSTLLLSAEFSWLSSLPLSCPWTPLCSLPLPFSSLSCPPCLWSPLFLLPPTLCPHYPSVPCLIPDNSLLCSHCCTHVLCPLIHF